MKNIHSGESQDIISKINEYLFNGELEDIIEVTYAYSKTQQGYFINRTLFSDFIKTPLNLDDVNDLEERYKKSEAKLKEKKDIAQKFLQEISKVSYQSNERIDILRNSLLSLIDIIDVTLLALPFEIQKAGYSILLNSEEVKSRVQKIESIESKLFSGMIRDNDKEVELCRNYFVQLLKKGSEKLSEDQINKFLGYLNQMGISLQSGEANISVPSLKKDSLHDQKILDRPITREQYIQIFKIVFSIYGIEKPIIVDERSSIYDGDKALYIPNTSPYNTLTVLRVLSLIQHEIETHYLIEKNNKVTLGEFRGSNNLEREEGLAMLSEAILKGSSFDQIGITESFPEIFAGEVLNGDEFKDFLSILNTLKGKSLDINSYLRRKRNYPLNDRGVQHKDATYTRGRFKVIDFIKQGKDVRDLYIGKVSFRDIEKLKAVKERESIEIYTPLLISELLLYVLNGQKLDKTGFISYIISKYPFLKVLLHSDGKDVMDFTFSTKRKILQILKIIKES